MCIHMTTDTSTITLRRNTIMSTRTLITTSTARGHTVISTIMGRNIITKSTMSSITQCEEPHELVTPTGAAILAEFVEQFGPLQLIPEKIGYGLGERNNKTRPNVLRAVIGRSISEQTTHDWDTDQVAVLETNLDDI